MNIVFYKGCCNHGIVEYHAMTDLLRQKNIDFFTHITRKTGSKGMKRLTQEQREDDRIYVEDDTDNIVMELTEYIWKLRNL